LVASSFPQTLVAVFQHVYLMDVVMVDMFDPPHTMYLLQNSVANSHKSPIILIVVPVLRPPLCSDLRTKSDLTVDVSDVIENIVGCTVLLVLEDG
jgi:hypothetical protein